MTILVTNANGKVGQELVRLLLAQGADVRIGARTVAKAQAAFPGARIVPFDYGDKASIRAALEGVDTVFTAAFYETLPASELNLLEVAKEMGVTRIVKLSAMGIEANDASAHRIVEKAIEASGISWTFLRPNFFMQNYALMMADVIREGGALYEPAEGGKTSFVDTRDIAAVAAAALTSAAHAGKAYTLTGPEALDRSEVAAAISAAAGRPVAYVPVDDAALRGAMAGAHPALIELMSALYGYVRAGWTAAVSPDITTVLGRPARSFADFAHENATVWQKAA